MNKDFQGFKEACIALGRVWEYAECLMGQIHLIRWLRRRCKCCPKHKLYCFKHLSCVLTRPKHDKSDHEWNMFRSEKCSHQIMHCANHDRNMIILIMIETTSRGSFNHDQMKHVQNGGWIRRRGAWPKDPKLGLLWVQFSRWNMGQWRNTTSAISDEKKAQ